MMTIFLSCKKQAENDIMIKYIIESYSDSFHAIWEDYNGEENLEHSRNRYWSKEEIKGNRHSLSLRFDNRQGNGYVNTTTSMYIINLNTSDTLASYDGYFDTHSINYNFY